MLTTHTVEWRDGGWFCVLTDGYHTWHGKSVFLFVAYAIAFTRYSMDFQ